MRGSLVAMLALVGCDQVFQLDRPEEQARTSFRKPLTLQPLAGGLVDFPVAVVLDDADLAAHGVGGAIAFTGKDGARLDHEIEFHDGGRLAAWVRIPMLEPATVIHLHYGVLSEELAQPRAPFAVWRSEYAGVWHFAGDDLAEVPDSTNRGNDLEQLAAALQPALREDGIVGPARQFDGMLSPLESDTLVARDHPSLDPTIGESFSYAVWVNVERNVGAFDMPLFKGGSCEICPGYDFELGDGGWAVQISDGVMPNVDKVTYPAASADARLGRWTHLVGVIDRPTAKLSLYVDGNLVGMDSVSEVDLGNSLDLQFSTTGALMAVFAGAIDEARIYRGALSAAWIGAEHRNLTDRDRFLLVGNEEIVE